MTRRAHKKSRNGCITCKKRRVKCDEQRPTCQNCIVRGISCAYKSPARLTWVDKTNTRTIDREKDQNHESSPSSSPEAALSSGEGPHVDIFTASAAVNLEGLELIIHWFTTTVHTVVPPGNTDALNICQTVILHQAMRHHFLLHGLLAFSALDIARRQSDLAAQEKYTKIATAHHNLGIAQYHLILKDINDSNYSASIAFSSITVMFAFAISRPLDGTARTLGVELIDNLAQIFLLAKGWYKVVGVAKGLGCNRNLNFFSDVNPNENPSLPVDIENAFTRLHELNRTYNCDGDTELYNLAIDSLKKVFGMITNVDRDSINPHVALTWVFMVPEKFIRLLGEHQSFTLVLIAYYCVVIDHMPHVWWLSGWSKGLLSIIWQSIEPEYQGELRWARKMVGIE